MTITFNETGKLKVTIEERIDDADIEIFYELYEQAFGPLRTKAAARQVLHPEEFREEMVDPRVMKYVTWSEDGEPLSLTTLTNDLATIPWISPDYYRAKFPEKAARGAVYYLGFTLVRNDARLQSVFSDVVALLISRFVAENAVMCIDICSYNISIGFDDVLRRLGTGVQTPLDELDAQTYFVADFTAAAERLAAGH